MITEHMVEAGAIGASIHMTGFPYDVLTTEQQEELRVNVRTALTAALQGSVVVSAKPFGYHYWKSNGDGTESPDFCEGEVPSYVRVVRGLTPLYTQSVSRNDLGGVSAPASPDASAPARSPRG